MIRPARPRGQSATPPVGEGASTVPRPEKPPAPPRDAIRLGERRGGRRAARPGIGRDEEPVDEISGAGYDHRSSILAWQDDAPRRQRLVEADRAAVVEGLRAIADSAAVQLLAGDERWGPLAVVAEARRGSGDGSIWLGQLGGPARERVPLVVGRLRLGAVIVVGARIPSRQWLRIGDPLLRLARVTLHADALAASGVEHAGEVRRARRLMTAAMDQLHRRVAEQLHGRVQTRLVVLWHRLGDAAELVERDPEGARHMLGQVRELLDQLRERDVRPLSHRLHPASTRVGLEPALRSLAGEFGRSLRVELHLDPPLCALDEPSAPTLSEPLRFAAYRIIEEALGNAVHHSHARVVRVRVSLPSPSALEIDVSDDGVGLPDPRPRPGLGLTTIADRVDGLGGRWRIRGAPGRGTSLWVRIPLPDATTGAGRDPLQWIEALDHGIDAEVALAEDGRETEGVSRRLVGGGVAGRDQHHPGRRGDLMHPAGGDESCDVGHEQVHQDDVGVEPGSQVDGLSPVHGAADHRESPVPI